MASITVRGGRYLARVRREGYKSIAKTFIRRTDAAAWARRVEADMEGGKWVEEADKVPTLAEAIKDYRETVAIHMKGRATYKYRFDEFAATAFAAKPINEVTAHDLAVWRDDQAVTLKPATVVRKLAMLSGVFGWAMRERGWVTVNPLSRVSRPRLPEGRSRTLSPAEFECLMTAAKTSKAEWLPHALTVFAFSAMRRSELAQLKRSDLDLEAATAYLSETKAGGSRVVPLCPEALAAVRALATEAEKRKEEALVPLGAAGSISTRFIKTVRRARAQYLKDCIAAGVDAAPGFLADVRLHDLRHQAVSHWAETGALSLPELMAISGHKTLKMLNRYCHLSVPILAAKMATISTKQEVSA